jgi:hypothetical protein
MLERLEPGSWPVLTVHAEMEGGAHAGAFADFLARANARGVRCLTLGRLLEERQAQGSLPACRLEHAPVPGRHGVVSMQLEEPARAPGPRRGSQAQALSGGP